MRTLLDKNCGVVYTDKVIVLLDSSCRIIVSVSCGISTDCYHIYQVTQRVCLYGYLLSFFVFKPCRVLSQLQMRFLLRRICGSQQQNNRCEPQCAARLTTPEWRAVPRLRDAQARVSIASNFLQIGVLNIWNNALWRLRGWLFASVPPVSAEMADTGRDAI